MKGKTLLTISFTTKDRLKANRRASRIIEIEIGTRPSVKVHKNKKKYNRKDKHK